MKICESFLCEKCADDSCKSGFCGYCSFCDCAYCVYYHRVSESEEECVLQDGCGCGQTFNPD